MWEQSNGYILKSSKFDIVRGGVTWRLNSDDVDSWGSRLPNSNLGYKRWCFSRVSDSELSHSTPLFFTNPFPSSSKLLSSSSMATTSASKIMSLSLSVILGLSLFLGLVSSAKFDQLFQPYWASDHFTYEGELLHMKLDKFSGAGFSSKNKYMFGKVTVQIKLIEGDSAGTVTAFYMSSDGPLHNEFDFEFLGNTTGEPYSVQTNLYINGVGNREQRLDLWFDPTTDFHSYSIFWNQRQVVFLVDETPIRVHTNMESKGLPFPKDQPMGVYSSIWNADDWATQGGRVKTDWSHGPFVASYKGFAINACECPVSVAGVDNAKKCTSSADKKYWWDEPVLSELNVHQNHQLVWVKNHHMVYDYCTDTARFPVTPVECVHHGHHRH
ncbi:xyloglucan endotransglucosylase protein 6 [Rosa rugosa]|uniref:xyloglucan endotransglucosylase protein 6 n=1 Tax=Rosa rugosa TaxID=74645 RepID=UPI002B407A5C|nr:xyloglucan endotransglucosylase protein 6 [Rosa rugosa]